MILGIFLCKEIQRENYLNFHLELLAKINSDQANSNGSASSHDHVRRRRRTNSGHKEEETKAEPVEKNYTPEQVEAVEKYV